MKKHITNEDHISDHKNDPGKNAVYKIFDFQRLDPFSIGILNSAPIPIWAYNEEGRVTFWNVESEKIFGYSLLSILNDPDPLGLFNDVKNSGETLSIEKKLVTKTGKQLVFTIYGTVRPGEGHSFQVWLFGNDITSYKTHEKEQEKRLEHLFNLQKIINRSESIAYIRKNDLNWTVTYISVNCNRIGYEPEAFKQRKLGFSELIHPQDVARIKAEVLFATHQKVNDIHLEYRLVTKNGTHIWVSDVLDIIYDHKDSATSFQGVITDISMQKSSEEKISAQNNIIRLHNNELFKVNETLKQSFNDLRITNKKLIESEEKFKVISEQSLLGILIIHDGLIKYFNQAFLDASGYTKEEVEKWKKYEFINIVHPNDRSFIINRLEQRMKSEIIDDPNFTFRGITKNGETKWFSQWAKTIMFDGKKSAFVTIIDIDERQKWQEALAESENRLRAKLDFILSPEKPLGDFSITDIFEIEQLQKLQDAFALSHNITSVITNIEGKPITHPSNISPICKVVRSSKKGRELCELSDKTIGEKVRKSLKPYSAKCLSCGFIETGAPIIVAGKHIANWMIGQGLNKSIDENRLVEIAEKFGIEGYKLLDAYQNTNFIKPEHFNKIIGFLWVMAKEISLLGYNNIKLARDVEERKKVEEELIRSKNRAEESDRLKSAFLANMSHEIRTPMNGILGFANILNEEELSVGQRREYIEIINQNADILLKMIDDILDIAKMEANQLILEEKPCYIDKLLNDQYQLFKNKIEQHKSKNIKLILKLPDIKLDKLIYADETRLVQIISNLLTNAVKFTQKGSIEFGYHAELPKQLKFYVKDTGIGLDPEKKSMIFDRFRQVDESNSRKYGGTGLGLAISRNLIKLMKGNIWVESQIGKGAIFYFTLPYKPFSDNQIITSSTNNELENACDFSGKQILIAEDEQLNFHFLYEILKNTNVKILHARNGDQAIEMCKKNALIDLVLMDMKMPQTDGFQATREIKTFRPELPIIAQTACDTPKEKALCLSAGCSDYIAKPIYPAKLLTIINNSLKKINSIVK